MTTIPYLSVVRFSGADAADFLHNQLSNDVLGLAEGDSNFACYCEPKGRVLALMLVCRHDVDYYIIMADSLVQSVVGRLRMYVLRAKVDIDVMTQQSIVGIENQDIANAAEVATVIPLPTPDRDLLLMDTKTVDPSSDDAVSSWKAAELRHGITWLCPASSGQFLPQWLGFDQLGAVNFRKGCYPGQEIVARTKYLGKIKRHPRLLNLALDTCPAAMEKLDLSGEGHSADGVAVDCVKTGKDETLLFVVTRMEPELTVEQVDIPD